MSIPGQFDSRVHDIAYGSSSTLLGQGQLDPGQASGAFLPEEQANWPRRSHPWSSSLCNVTAEPGAEPRLPNAQLLALRPLSCMGPMSLDRSAPPILATLFLHWLMRPTDVVLPCFSLKPKQ